MKYISTIVIGLFVLTVLGVTYKVEMQQVHPKLPSNIVAPTTIPDPPTPEGYHLVIFQEGNKKYYGIEFCGESGCHLFGYHYTMNQLKAATETYEWFANYRKQQVVSIVK